ncbi:MAG: DUF6134 family protein [Ginsengibacter sp.]
MALVILSFFIFQSKIQSQERKLIYDVMKNGNSIGVIILLELTKDQKKILSLTSDVKTRFIFSFSDHSEEAAAYENGVMTYSSFYQKQNGSDKANKKTIASGNSYKLIDDGMSKSISCSPIRYNMLLLYTKIPETIYKVYSDNFQKLLDIKKVEENKYRVTLPDGNYNYYTYKNGVCSKVDIERTFYSVQFVLKEK